MFNFEWHSVCEVVSYNQTIIEKGQPTAHRRLDEGLYDQVSFILIQQIKSVLETFTTDVIFLFSSPCFLLHEQWSFECT